MTRRLYLHIGLQKTGTSYLQGIVLRNQRTLARQGIDVIPDERRKAYWLMLDARDRFAPHDPPRAREILPGLPAALAAAKGDRALVSEESLSPCTDEQITRLLAHCGDREVHVIITVRDLARQIPSVWQQGVQSGRTVPYDRYLKRLRATQGTDAPIWFQKDIAGVLTRWSRHVPAERIHVVTVPPSGSDPDLLLQRFCSVIGAAPASLDLSSVGRANRGLRLEQAEVLRRVNERIPEELMRRDTYGDAGKRYLSVQVLGGAEGRKILLPASQAEWCRETSRAYLEHLRSAAYDVVGDLGDLEPLAASFAEDDQEVTEAQVAEAAVAGLTTIVNTRLERSRDKRDAANRPEGPLRRVARRLRERLSR